MVLFIEFKPGFYAYDSVYYPYTELTQPEIKMLEIVTL